MSKIAPTADLQQQQFFNVAEAAAFLRVSEKTVRREIKNGSITIVKWGDRILFERDDLVTFMRQHKVACFPAESHGAARLKRSGSKRLSNK